jgi:hypothetical protein
MSQLAVRTESNNKNILRQSGSKIEEEEVIIIFSEVGTTSEGDVQENEASEDSSEIELQCNLKLTAKRFRGSSH